MLGEWSKKPGMMIAVVAVLALILISFFWSSSPESADDQFERAIHESAGFVAAEEAAKVLGESGGSVALVLPPYGSEERFPGSLAEIYKNGFEKGVGKISKLRVLGHWAANPKRAIWFRFEQFAEAREKYPAADLLVVFWSLPQSAPEEEIKWRSVVLPKMIVIETRQEETANSKWLERGFVQRVLWFNGKTELPEKKPKDPHEIFSQYFKIIGPR